MKKLKFALYRKDSIITEVSDIKELYNFIDSHWEFKWPIIKVNILTLCAYPLEHRILGDSTHMVMMTVETPEGNQEMVAGFISGIFQNGNNHYTAL